MFRTSGNDNVIKCGSLVFDDPMDLRLVNSRHGRKSVLFWWKRKELCEKVSTTYSTYQKNIFYINMLKESYLSKLCFNNCKLSHFSAKYLDCYGRWNLYKQMNNSHWDKEIVIKITITASLETTNVTESSASSVIEHAVSVMHCEWL